MKLYGLYNEAILLWRWSLSATLLESQVDIQEGERYGPLSEGQAMRVKDLLRSGRNTRKADQERKTEPA